jgi:hypothetical protein
VYYSKVYR